MTGEACVCPWSAESWEEETFVDRALSPARPSLGRANEGGQLETSDSCPAVPPAKKRLVVSRLALASVESKQARATKPQEQPELVLVLVPPRDLQVLQWLLDG